MPCTKELCRICLVNSASISIFTVSSVAASTAENEEITPYNEQIMRCTRIEMTEDVGLPAGMCTTCEAELAVSYRFLLKCEASDSVLRKLTESEALLPTIIPANDIKEEDTSDNLEFGHMKEEYLDTDGAFSDNEILQIQCVQNVNTEMVKEESYELNSVDLHLKVRKKMGRPRKRHKDVKKSKDIVQKSHNLKTESDDEDAQPKEKRKRGRPRKDPDMLQPKYIPKLQKMSKPTTKPCPVCGLLVHSPSAMIIHLRVHSDERPFACDQCNTAFKAKGTLKRHIEVHHKPRERKYVCENCGGRFYRKRDVVIHMRRHTGEKPHACPICSMRFIQIGTLIRHKRTHTGEKPFSCEICFKAFADKNMIRKHMSVHSEERKYSCHLCGKALKTSNALRTHVHLHSNEKTFVCSECGMAFALKGNLTLHMSKVHSDLSGHCEVCSKAVSNLKTHMNKHTGELPFHCDQCSQSFISKQCLGNHQKYRHGTRNKYKCTEKDCNRVFPAQSMLTFHTLKFHTNHTPYICKLCKRGFFRVSDLSRHLTVSHNQICKKPEDLKNESTTEA